MAPVLVTGASGFIGTALVYALRAARNEVVAVDLAPFPDPRVKSVVGDLKDPSVLALAMASEPHAIVHLAARTSVLRSVMDPDGVFDVNVEVTQRLLEAARQHAVNGFVFASSNAVVGEVNGAVIDEATPMRPLTPYGATKAAAEMLCAAYASCYGIAACAIRLTNVFGLGMGAKDTFIVRLMRAAAAGRPVTIYGDGLQERDYLYVDDAVAAMLLALERALSGPIVIGSGRSISVLDLCRLAEEAVGHSIATLHTETPSGEMRAVRVDISHARALGYEPRVTLPDGLTRTWQGLRAEVGGATRATP